MRRFTRRIGLFGGPAAIMRSAGVRKTRVVRTEGSASAPTASPAKGAGSAPEEAPADAGRKSWFRRLFSSKGDRGKD